MKKKLLSFVALSALLMGGLTALAACKGSTTIKQSESSAVASSSEDVTAKFTVSYEASQQYTINGLKGSYEAGEKVTFTIIVNDKTKQVSAVRVNGEKISPDKDGKYSFDMPGEDARLRITLVDADIVTLSAFYTGNTMVGETLTVTTKIDFAENNELLMMTLLKQRCL